MVCKLLNADLRTLSNNFIERPRTACAQARGACHAAISHALAAGLLLCCAVAPGLAGAAIPDKSYREAALHQVHDSVVGASETPAAEPAAAVRDLSAPSALLEYLEQQQCADVASTASLLMAGVEIARSAGYDTPDPLLLACLAKPESKFNDAAVGSAGERGLLQVHPCHKRSMAKLGLDFNTGSDRVAYACVLWDSSGLKPWTTRRAAQREYQEWSAK